MHSLSYYFKIIHNKEKFPTFSVKIWEMKFISVMLNWIFKQMKHSWNFENNAIKLNQFLSHEVRWKKKNEKFEYMYE